MTGFQRWARGVPPLNDVKFTRFKAIVAIDERQSSTIEHATIVIAACYKIFFWERRWLLDLGYDHERPDTQRVVLLALFQIACTAVIDLACTYQELFQSIPLVNVWRGRNRLHVLLEIVTIIAASFLLLTTFHVVPYAGNCESADVCTCGFAATLPPVMEHCGLLTPVATDGTLCDATDLAQCTLELCGGGGMR